MRIAFQGFRGDYDLMNTIGSQVIVDQRLSGSELASSYSRREGILVVQPPDAVSHSVEIVLLEGQSNEPLAPKTFVEALDAMLSCSFKVIVLLETPAASFSPTEAHVIERMAGPADIVRIKLPAVRKVAPIGPEGLRSVGGLVGEERTGLLWAHSKMMNFSKSEAAVVWTMLRSSRHYATTSDLMSTLDIYESARSANKLRQFIHRIRRKLSMVGDPAIVISNRKGYGLVAPE
jgi:DNA-binding response OmpR family regulator